MSLCNRVVLPLILFSLAVLAGCGSSSNTAVAPPTGGFSNTNLSGTYVFSTFGSDVNGVLIVTAGTFTACGCPAGTISAGGALDANDPLQGTLQGEPITGGSYSIGVDGRPGKSSGLLTLQTAAASFTYDFVLSSSEHGLITLYDVNNGTGSGTLDLQTTVTQASINGQSYAFNFSGIGSYNSGTGAETPFATAGAFTLDANGQIGTTTTGVADINDDGISACVQATGCAITSGFIDLSTAPGTATLTTSAGIRSFDVYPITPTHMKFIETDALPVVAGDVFAQSSSISTGNNVFSLAGYDSSAAGPFAAVGIIDTDGGGNVNSDSVEDINDVGTAAEVGSITGGTAITGSYSSLTGGRSLITLAGFVNGNAGTGCVACQFAAYPSTGGVQLLEIDNGGITAGVAYAQGGSPALASSQAYAVNITGVSPSGEEDDIAEFTNKSGAFAGLIDFNDQGALAFDNNFSSSYTADSTVSGRGMVRAGSNAYDLATYVVDSTNVVFVDTDTTLVGVGSFVTQNATAKSDAAARHLTVVGMKAGAKKALKRQ